MYRAAIIIGVESSEGRVLGRKAVILRKTATG